MPKIKDQNSFQQYLKLSIFLSIKCIIMLKVFQGSECVILSTIKSSQKFYSRQDSKGKRKPGAMHCILWVKMCDCTADTQNEK